MFMAACDTNNKLPGPQVHNARGGVTRPVSKADDIFSEQHLVNVQDEVIDNASLIVNGFP
jgi:hypothetical protein